MKKEEILKAINALGVREQREILMELLPPMCQWANNDPEFREHMMKRCGMPPQFVESWMENIKNIMAKEGKMPCCK